MSIDEFLEEYVLDDVRAEAKEQLLEMFSNKHVDNLIDSTK